MSRLGAVVIRLIVLNLRSGCLGLFLMVPLCLVGCSKTSVDEVVSPTHETSSEKEQGFAEPSLAIEPVEVTPRSSTAWSPSNRTDARSESAMWIWLAAIALALALASTLLSAYLFVWRRRLPDGQTSVVPEIVLKSMEQLASYNVSSLKAASADRDLAENRFSEIQKSFEIFADITARKDDQIERLQQGSDKQVYRNFLKRFVRVLSLVDDDIEEDRKAGKDTHALESLQRYLLDALQDSGLEEFSPSIGADYRQQNNVADRPEVLRTDDRSLDWKISSVVKPGFSMRSGHEPIMVEPAKVEIFRFEDVGD